MKLLVIDGNSIINRAFYGIRLLSNKNGVYTNAVTGFLNIYLKLTAAYSPDGVAAAFDLKAPTFRHKSYDAYKAGRHGMPDELHMQLPYVKELLTALGAKVVECEGFEADDILGTLAHECEKAGWECIIATGDRDSLQLITDMTFVNLASNKEDILYTPEKLSETYGVTPAEMIEVKALMGDSSDNIPGVAGIGEKTAFSLIQKYHDIEYIYSNIDSIDVTKSVRERLKKGEESARLSHFLGTIVKNAPIDTDVLHYVFAPRDEKKLASLLTGLEMFSMMKKLSVNKEAAEEAAKEIQNAQPAEEAGAEHLPADIAGYFIEEEKLFRTVNGDVSEVKQEDYGCLQDDTKKKTSDLKTMLSKLNVTINNVVFDTTLAGYLLDPAASDYSLERLCQSWSVTGENTAQRLAALDDMLYGKLCAQGMYKLLTDIELPLAQVLVSMEKEGVEIDRASLETFGEELSARATELESSIYESAGVKEFNIASPKQLGEILFEKLGLPNGKKTKTGYSTNAEVLEGLIGEHEIIGLIMEYRAVTKLRSTYAQGLLKEIAGDGRIHTTFRQTETRTGRISSVEPNIQNIPVRTPLGREFRRFFRAKEGHVLVDADYSQIELRVLAHMSGDEAMKEAFLSGEDIHTVTASQVFDQPVEWVTPEMRRSAKAVNFGIVYGIGAFSLSKDIGVSVPQADKYIKAYLSKYRGVDEYMKKTVEDGKKNGFVTTLWGRRRYIPELRASNKNVQALGRRMAMNTPVQGSAADIIKLAMIKVSERLEKELPDSRLILQVHDELIVEAPEESAEKAAALLKEEMENAVKLCVPLTVDVKYGRTWYDAH